MMKRLILALATITVIAPAACAQSLLPTTGKQEPKPEEQKATIGGLPKWILPLTNLPEDARLAYVTAFTQAKKAYADGHLIECLAQLNTCEIYFRENPHVWLLYSGVYINKKEYDKALTYIQKALKVEPDNDVAKWQLSLIHLAKGDYEAALQQTEKLQRQPSICNGDTGPQHSLMYRQFLCLIMLDKVAEAKELIAHITAMDDSPLYYYCQAAFRMLEGNPGAATSELNSADFIYSLDAHLPGYKQNLDLCGLREKMQKKAAETQK